MIKSKLINAYYLPELRKFYEEKQEKLNYEYELTGNDFIKNISFVLNNIIVKIDYFIKKYKNGEEININELSDYFLINKFNNNVSNDTELQNKKDIYKLINKFENDDNLEDDFYYDT